MENDCGELYKTSRNRSMILQGGISSSSWRMIARQCCLSVYDDWSASLSWAVTERLYVSA
jgi:hypothetical protein